MPSWRSLSLKEHVNVQRNKPFLGENFDENLAKARSFSWRNALGESKSPGGRSGYCSAVGTGALVGFAVFSAGVFGLCRRGCGPGRTSCAIRFCPRAPVAIGRAWRPFRPFEAGVTTLGIAGVERFSPTAVGWFCRPHVPRVPFGLFIRADKISLSSGWLDVSWTVDFER